MMTDALPGHLVSYLIERDNQRAQAVTEFLAKLTPRERGLFHDAVVMGYVQGIMRSRDEGCPTDSEIIDACLAFDDKYPTVNAIARAAGPEPVWQIQTKHRGTWRQWLADRQDSGDARAEYDRCVAANGHRWAFRLVRTDTTRVVEAQHSPARDDADTEEA